MKLPIVRFEEYFLKIFKSLNLKFLNLAGFKVTPAILILTLILNDLELSTYYNILGLVLYVLKI